MDTNLADNLFTDIPVLYQDSEIIVMEKPAGLPVHKNDFMVHDAPYLTKIAGNITGRRIYSVHRLDAKTSGLIVMTFSSEAAAILSAQFEQREVNKKYVAVVKGNPGEGVFNSKVLVRKKANSRKEAVTNYTTLKSVFTDISYKDQANIVLSLVEIFPETGRWHQIRQHFAVNRYDIVGDNQHGDFTLNKIVTERTGIRRMLFHATSTRFTHPRSKEKMEFNSTIPEEFNYVIDSLKIDK
jgi:tRNA pseudouridine65 synthase